MIDLQSALPLLLPKAIAWATAEASRAATSGQPPTSVGEKVARSVGVARPELIRIALVDELPTPASRIYRRVPARLFTADRAVRLRELSTRD